MTISDKNRKLFEGIGFEAIRREVTLGNNYYLPIDQAAQAEAREWVAEQEEKNRVAERIRTARETKVFSYTFWTLIAAIAAVLVGVIGVVVSLLKEPG
jgi:t-SNARE complex subunit (syntaxin)